MILCLSCLSLSFVAQAQGSVIMIAPTPADTMAVFQLNQAGVQALDEPNGWLNAISFHSQAYQKAGAVNYLKGEAMSIRYLIQAEMKAAGRRVQIIEYFLKELEIREEIGNFADLAATYEVMGDYYTEYVDLEDAIGYYQQAIILRRKHTPFAKEILSDLTKIAKNYAVLGQKDKGLHAFIDIMQQHIQREEYEDAVNLCVDISEIYTKQKEYKKALEYAQRAESYYKKQGKSALLPTFAQSIQALKQKIPVQDTLLNSQSILMWILITIAGLAGTIGVIRRLRTKKA